ncbi:transposase [Streptomyces niveus]|uniref:Transposase n=1 Tax=Streptomyces niveus TaxID=193462 RepID=A0ABZ2AEX9_STRNV|nr:transposase [Streptomyces niveus]
MEHGKNGRPKRKDAEIYPLSEKLFGLCGSHYVGQKQTLSGQRWYRCSGKHERYPGAPVCECNGIPSDLVETELWTLLIKVLSNPKELQKAAAEYLDMTADQKVSFEDRIEELGRQIEVQARAIKAAMTVTAKIAAIEGKNDEEIEAEVEATVAPLMHEKTSLEHLRAEAVQWQLEADAANDHAKDLKKLAETARRRLHQLTLSEQAEVLNLLGLKVRVTQAAPPAPKGAPCPVRTWFEERDLKIPARVGEEAWRHIEPIVSAGDRPCRADQRFDHREAVEGILHKARTAGRWSDVPLAKGTGKGLSSRFRRWRESGIWDQVMEFLTGEEATELPPARKIELPKMEVEGGFILQELLGSLTTFGGTLPSSTTMS